MRYTFALIVPLLCMIGGLTPPVAAQGGPGGGSGEKVHLTTRWNQTEARPGDQRVLAVVLDIDAGYHVNPQPRRIPESEQWLIPTTVQASPAVKGQVTDDASTAKPQSGQAFQVGPAQFPEPKVIEVNYSGSPTEMAVYSGQVVIYLPLIMNASAEPGKITFDLAVQVQACDDKVCLRPETLTRDISLTVVSADGKKANEGTGGSTNASNDGHSGGSNDLFAGFDQSVFAKMQSGNLPVQAIDFYFFKLAPTGVLGLTALFLLAALGGLLLNFTPCVLPVIPLKVMSLSKSAGSDGKRLGLGLAMAVGVVGFWVAIGGAIALLADFNAVNQLFQTPWFTIGVGVVIAVLAIGMCGLFSIQLPGWVYHISPSQDSYAGSFGFGIMTAVLSTPCTAPFMGAAAAWATQQNPTLSLATFGSIGMGMALPYLVLAAVPKLIDRLPRTGPGSELIKQVMGLLMLAAAAYFVGVGLGSVLVSPPDPPSRVYWWVVVGFIAVAGLWMSIQVVRISRSPVKRIGFSWLGVAVLVGAIFLGFRLTDRGPIDWVYYTPQRFEQALANDQVVVMDFTAEWCLNCKALEQGVLFQDRVHELLSEDGITPMKVDLTNASNAAGNAKLQEAGRVTIPLLVVYDARGNEVLNQDFYTAKQVIRAVHAAREQSLAERR